MLNLKSNLKPPLAPKKAHTHLAHGDLRVDHYFWLNDRKKTEVIDYLNAENEYATALLKHTKPLREQLVEEMYSRIVESDTSVPVKFGSYEYYSKDEQESDYRSHWRRKVGDPQSEELLIDQNKLADGHKFFELGEFFVSHDDKLIACATDLTGNEIYTIEFMRISDRQPLSVKLSNCSGNFVWGRDSTSIYYTTLNDSHRAFRVYRHRLGDRQDQDELILEEDDEAFDVSLSYSDSWRFIQIQLDSQITSEVYLLDESEVQPHPKLIFKRKANVRYCVEDRGEDLYVLTNDDAVNFRLVKTSLSQPDQSEWIDVIPHQEQVSLNDFQVFSQFIAVEQRCNGLPTVRVLTDDTGEGYTVDNPDKIQELRLDVNLEFDSQTCRLGGNALDMPYSVFDLDLATGETRLLKTQPVAGEFNPLDYATERHLATSHDGTQIPIYLVYNRKRVDTRPAPLLLSGYGSYGYSSSLYFSSKRLCLLDRGIIFATTQIRGGSEMGENWYLDGKLDKKKNTFHDFNACADYLINAGITSPERLAIMGGSAGGLVVGNFLNSPDHKCKAALALVPFVDIVTTILDDALPLSISERDEWGDPNDAKMYDYMKSYSPYDNIQAKNYPALMITAGMNDPRVGYWEPAKWAAKIRQHKTDDNPLLLITEMESGHSGASGRFDSLHEIAREFAFIIDQLLQDGEPASASR